MNGTCGWPLECFIVPVTSSVSSLSVEIGGRIVTMPAATLISRNVRTKASKPQSVSRAATQNQTREQDQLRTSLSSFASMMSEIPVVATTVSCGPDQGCASKADASEVQELPGTPTSLFLPTSDSGHNAIVTNSGPVPQGSDVLSMKTLAMKRSQTLPDLEHHSIAKGPAKLAEPATQEGPATSQTAVPSQAVGSEEATTFSNQGSSLSANSLTLGGIMVPRGKRPLERPAKPIAEATNRADAPAREELRRPETLQDADPAPSKASPQTKIDECVPSESKVNGEPTNHFSNAIAASRHDNPVESVKQPSPEDAASLQKPDNRSLSQSTPPPVRSEPRLVEMSTPPSDVQWNTEYKYLPARAITRLDASLPQVPGITIRVQSPAGSKAVDVTVMGSGTKNDRAAAESVAGLHEFLQDRSVHVSSITIASTGDLKSEADSRTPYREPSRHSRREGRKSETPSNSIGDAATLRAEGLSLRA